MILMDPPGAGKGPQAEHLIDQFDIPQLLTEEMLRAAVTEGSEFDRRAKHPTASRDRESNANSSNHNRR